MTSESASIRTRTSIEVTTAVLASDVECRGGNTSGAKDGMGGAVEYEKPALVSSRVSRTKTCEWRST